MRLHFFKPSGDLMWIALPLFAGGLYLLWLGVARETWVLGNAGAAAVIVSVGLWFEQPWARWAGIALFSVPIVFATIGLVNGQQPVVKAFIIIGLGYCIWVLWRWPTRPASDKPLTSLVLLLRRPRGLNATMLRESGAAAWRIEYGDGENARNYVVGESPIFLMSNEGALYMVHNHNTSYFDDTKTVAENLGELRLSAALHEHNAWIAVDLMDGGERIKNANDAYPEIAKLLAELSGPDCAAIFCPETGAINVYDNTLEEKLRGPDPLSAVREPVYAPVIQIAEDDPRMLAAVAEARQRWPEFVGAFNARKPDQIFGVKAPITRGGQTEFIWLTVSRIEGDTIHGNLDNDPVNPDLKCGEAVSVPLADLNDWAYSDSEKMVGPFTLKVLQEAAKERRDEA
jgi:uncharacterized protein YegJ (DUF2314 family)